MTAKERLLSCLQANKSVLDLMICSGKRIVTGEMKLVELETLNSTIASFFLKSFAFNAADAIGELTGFFPRIDRIFPSSTSKRYSKGKGLGFRAENLGVG